MTRNDTALCSINKDIERISTQKPYVKEILDAFRPMIIEKKRLLMEMQSNGKTFPLDQGKYLAGVPLVQQCDLFFPGDPWQKISLGVCKAIREGFPNLAENMERLAQQITSGQVNVFEYFRSSDDPDEKEIKAWAEKIPMDPGALGVFIHMAAGIILAKRAREAAEAIASLSWSKGYCPVCGSFPMLAVTKERGEKWLQCSQCSHEWVHPRLKCPYCEQESPMGTDVVFVDTEKEDKAFLCDKCKKYLITINRPAELEKTDPIITAIGLTHLDLLLQEKGFTPMASCLWNAF